jgi:hypothetical protein
MGHLSSMAYDSEGDVTRPSRDNRTQRLYRQIYSETAQRSQAAVAASIVPVADSSYDETVIAVHHSRKGLRIVLQANHRALIVIALIVIILLAHNVIFDTVLGLLKAVFVH